MDLTRARATLLALLFGLLAAGLSGCGLPDRLAGGEDHALEPSELVDFEASVEVDTLWRRRIGSGIDDHFLKLRPVHDGALVFAAGHDGEVVACDALTGDVVWETETDAPLSGGPGVGEGLVVVGTLDGEVIALDAERGTVQWRAGVTSEVLASPLAARGVVVVRTADGKLFGLARDSGRRLWAYDRTMPVLTLRGTGSPVLFRDMVIAGFDGGRVVAISLSDGETRWETPVAVPSGRSELERIVDIDADLVIADDTVYVVTFQGQMTAMDARLGAILWRRDMSSHAGMGLDYSSLYVSDEMSHVWALDRLNGASLWRQQRLQGRGLGAPVRLGDHVIVADADGYVHWLRREDGHFAARMRVRDGVLAPPVAAGEAVYVLDRGGTLSALVTR